MLLHSTPMRTWPLASASQSFPRLTDDDVQFVTVAPRQLPNRPAHDTAHDDELDVGPDLQSGKANGSELEERYVRLMGPRETSSAQLWKIRGGTIV